ncbi:pyrroline-5-carboxylate reductase family protein [Roseibium litorale]|uniref:Pyrroline-5-carboxylate reductase dimerisation domain-containing protein n=1 Tax=Roseibium litorale TaxID=2803841 RepID=A0ABR9CK15_9HYPH|nr:pyrroline-5-carboxylate reductase dimerization domain-containing protein [Roseibium litorale]MBD8891182.1 hypothetical protein [Roseibium litorale]
MLETAATRQKQRPASLSAKGHVDVLSFGCSEIAAAILAGWEKQNPHAALAVVDPHVERIRDVLSKCSRIRLLCRADRAKALKPEILLLAGKAAVLDQPCPALVELAQGAIVVSIIPGLSLDLIKERLETEKVARVTPNLPVMVGEGMSIGHCSPSTLTSAEQKAVASLMASVGQFNWLENESHFDLASAVSGDGPGFVFSLAEQMIMTLYTEGMPLSLAESLVQQTLFGASAMLRQDARSPAALKQEANLAGTSRTVLEHHDALPRLIPAAISEAHQRFQGSSRRMQS